MEAPALRRVTVSSFPGLDRRVGAPEGSAWEMTNLCAEGFPALQVRRRRGTVAQLDAPGGLTAKEALIWVDGHTLYVAGYPTGLVLREGEKQFVSMGAYLVIFPDKVWINLRDLGSFGSLENRVSTTAAVSLSLCRPDGQGFGAYTVSELAPQEAGEGALWLDGGVLPAVLRRYTQDGWEDVADVCVKLQSAAIGAGFQAGDGVEISGCAEPALNGRHVLRRVDGDAIVISGTVGGDSVQEGSITVARTVPDMDYVVQCGNRLWGCKYGMAEGRAVNELYALSREGTLLSLHGAEGTAESAVSWQVESGELGLTSAEHKYPMRLTLSLAPEAGSRVEAALSYDGGRTWQKGDTITGRGGAETVTLHLRPRRCARMRLRLQGSGGCTVYSVSAVYGKGSDET